MKHAPSRQAFHPTMQRQKQHPRPKFRLFPDRLDLTMPVDAAIWCFFFFFAVTFFFFLQKSNLTLSSATAFDPNHDLCHDNTKFTRSSVVLCIKLSKTIQHMDRLLFVPLPSFTGSDLCPVSAVLQHSADEAKPHLHFRRSSRVPNSTAWGLMV